MAIIPAKLTTLVAITGLACGLAAHAAEVDDAMNKMTGRITDSFEPPAPSPPSTMSAYGTNAVVEFPPRGVARPRRATRMRTAEISGSISFCVRTCDGRYFPAPSASDKQSRAEGCENLCPTSETKLFSGNSIDDASSRDGKPYSALVNAFRYRKELVAGCTCNGKDGGLASIKIEDDKTLRQGDIVATAKGLEVVNHAGNGRPGFSTASRSIRSQFERLPVVASQ
jgi:hypothetical protein